MDKLSIQYFFKPNTGPGDSRNYGCKKSDAKFFIFFDSDCIIPADYINFLRPELEHIDAYGGPDRAHSNFSAIQKAISYSMTSLFTTGGIRGGKRSAEVFHPRSFNMGISRSTYELTGGFSNMRFGEDIDLSIRIYKNGLNAKLLPECFVYHKRRTTFKSFFKQVFNSGIARINLFKRHTKALKIIHFFPSAFTVYQLASIPHAIYHQSLMVLYPTLFYLILILIDASIKAKSTWIGILSVFSSIVQLSGYGLGFILGILRRIILKQPEFHAYNKNFYN